MTSQRHEKSALDQGLKPNSFVYWQGRSYQVDQPNEDTADPLTVWMRDVETAELRAFKMEELLLPAHNDNQTVPVFAPTLEKLQQRLKEKTLLSPSPPATDLPETLRERADKIVTTVEAVQRLAQVQENLARLCGEKMHHSAALKQACSQLAKPISLSTYYEYWKLYRQRQGNRDRIAASLRRKTFNQTKMNKAQLHFIDILVLRYYTGKRTVRLRPQALFELSGSILSRTGNLWLDPAKCPGDGVENVIEELLDPRLPMQAILDNPEKRGWLIEIKPPSRSWFYTYLRWFEAQPDQGKEVIVARHGQEMWEREYMVFDTFVTRAVRPLQYVFADHWLVDAFIVDEATRSRLDRLWLTLLIDAYSRSVLGMALLYEAPCIESLQSALRHAIWPKISHQELGIKEEWVCYGIPQQLYLDNAWAHHSHSLEHLAHDISQDGRYNSIDLVFRPPYLGRYGALIERLFGNFSGQMKDLLPGAISSSHFKDIQNATRQACLLYQDIYAIVHQLIVRYQHRPHSELDHMTPHQKWLEGWQLGYGGWPPPLTAEVERLFWRRSSKTRVINRNGVSAFNMHYWSPALDQLPRKDMNNQRIHYAFSYDPNDISRLALSQDGQWLGDVYAKKLRRADGSTRSISLWEGDMAQSLARDKGQSSQDWLAFITEMDELGKKRVAEKKQAKRRSKTYPVNPQSRPIVEQAQAVTEQDYTDLLISFVANPEEVENG
ncbi:Mu transposase C-terminal domain-containing protein [Chloroflexota bacterium]